MKNIADGVSVIDSEAFGQTGLVSAYLVKGGGRTALIDPGFPASAPVIMLKLRAGGIDPASIDFIILTHFHIDHSGGTGAFLREAPSAKVVVHKRGAFYVKNFAKIVGGARMVFKPELASRFSEALPVPAENIMPVADGDIVDLGGGVKIRVIHTPGHSADHVSLFEEKSGSLFTGDVSALEYPALNRVPIPAASPPIFEIADEMASLRSLAGLETANVLIPHFGRAGISAAEFVQRNISAVENTRMAIAAMFREGLEFQQMVERLRSNIIMASGLPVGDIPEFLHSIYLREMLKTGLMGFFAYMLEYAPYPRPYAVEACKTEKILTGWPCGASA